MRSTGTCRAHAAPKEERERSGVGCIEEPASETSPESSRDLAQQVPIPNPLPRNDGSTKSSLTNHSSLELMRKRNPDRRTFVARDPRAARRAVGEIDVELPATLVGPAPRRHCPHVGFFSGADLRLVHGGSASSNARAARPRWLKLVLLVLGNLAERLADRRIIEQRIVAKAIFAAKLRRDLAAHVALHHDLATIRKYQRHDADEPRAATAVLVRSNLAHHRRQPLRPRRPRARIHRRIDPRTAAERVELDTRIICKHRRIADPRLEQLRTQRARFEQRVVDVALVAFFGIAIRRVGVGDSSGEPASIVRISASFPSFLDARYVIIGDCNHGAVRTK